MHSKESGPCDTNRRRTSGSPLEMHSNRVPSYHIVTTRKYEVRHCPPNELGATRVWVTVEFLGSRTYTFASAMSTPAPVDKWPDAPPFTLLADADADTRHMYAEYLRLSACEIDEADDGPTALAKAISRHHDIIVSETHLPGMSGFQLCEVLRSDPQTSVVPIIFVTSGAFDNEVRRAQTADVDAILIKPCLPETLASHMRRVLAQSRELRARGAMARQRARALVSLSTQIRDRSVRIQRRRLTLSRALERRFTTDPPVPPPTLVCPQCSQSLVYQRSHIGGVSERHAEQWDYFECAAGCGTFQYRQRTRKLRRVV